MCIENKRLGQFFKYGFQLLLDVLQYCDQAFSCFCECDELWYFFLVSLEDYGYVYPLDQGQRNDTVFWCIQVHNRQIRRFAGLFRHKHPETTYPL